MTKKKILIMGAQGKEFATFHLFHRDRAESQVVAFTRPGLATTEVYPPSLAGPRYPQGIPIEPEDRLPQLIARDLVDEVIFSYSGVDYEYLSRREQLVFQAGANFKVAEVEAAMIPCSRPVVAVCSSGCGKSKIVILIARLIRQRGKKPVIVVGPWAAKIDQRLCCCERLEDTDDCTGPEQEAYAPYLEQGYPLYRGSDYRAIWSQAQQQADILLWDGCSNDTPFCKPNLYLTLVDARRAGEEISSYPGRINLELAQILLISSWQGVAPDNLALVERNCRLINPQAKILHVDSPLEVSWDELLSPWLEDPRARSNQR